MSIQVKGNSLRTRSRITIALGMLFLWPLLRTQATGTLLVAASSAIPWAQSSYYIFLIVGVLFVAVALAAKNILQRVYELRWPVAALASVTAAANFGVALAVQMDALHPLLLVSSVLFYAVCIPVLVVAWAFVLVPLLKADFHVSSICIAASFVGSFVLGFLQYLPQPWPYLFPILCPLLAGWCWFLVPKSDARHSVASMDLPTVLRSLPLGSLASLVITMFLSCFLVGIARSGSIAISENIDLYYAKDFATIVVTTIIAFMLYALLASKRSTRVIWIFIFTVLCIGQLIILAFDDGVFALVGIGVSSAARASFSFFLYFYLLTLVYEEDLPVIPVFVSVFVSTNIVSDALSFAVVPAFSSALGVDYAGLIRPASLAVGIIVFLCLAFFSGSMALSYPRGERAHGFEGTASSQLQRQVDELASRYGVSERESEVMLYIVQGYSYKATASELGITEGTVQSHIKRLYVKLDVHSRQELIETVRSVDA